jgi:hypothetical protein
LWQDIPLNGANSSILAEHRKPYQGDSSSFINEDVGGLETLISFYNIWSENRHIPKNSLLVRNEDLHNDTAGQLKCILNFLGIGSVEEKIIYDAVQYTKFSIMHKMESNGSFNLIHLTPAEKGDPESYKTRKGIVGGFVEYFDEDEINILNQQINLKLSRFYSYSK